MTSATDISHPATTTRARRGRRWLTVLGAIVVTTAATAAAYVVAHSGNTPCSPGVHTVEIYTVVDEISTVVPAADRPGVLGRFIGMCDADTYYVEVDGAGLCLVLNGSLGTAQVTSTGTGVELSAPEAAKVRDIVRRDDQGDPQASTRVLLGYDDGWAGLVKVADLNAGGPVTGSVIG
jgi:hypothetical protein